MRHARGAAAAILAAALVAMGGAATVQAQEEDLSFEQRIIRSLLGGGNTGPGIDYRERSPLVIPPATDLPPPATGAGPTGSAAWPRDPDLAAQRRQTPRGLASDEAARAENPLSPGELMRGRRAGAGRQEGPARTIGDEDHGIPLKPSELGETRNLFGLIGRAVTPEKIEPFTGEPPRQRLTQPPPGYRTPASGQPYAPPARSRSPQRATGPDPAAGAMR